MDDRAEILAAAGQVAEAISRRDVKTLRGLLAPDFVHRSIAGESRALEPFLRGIEQIPGEILFVRLTNLAVDLAGPGAIVTGVQEAGLRIEGQDLEDQRPFVDWFVKQGQRWLIQVAVEVPE
jgi:ketosteroid isomerase-like protein